MNLKRRRCSACHLKSLILNAVWGLRVIVFY
uniref:Uncharacterized protein n=1 Tax=Anguilla anguilla TaxID=7936 RepID=A0A0E9XWS9_ANGAN